MNALPIAFEERFAPELGRFVELRCTILLVRVLGGAAKNFCEKNENSISEKLAWTRILPIAFEKHKKYL